MNIFGFFRKRKKVRPSGKPLFVMIKMDWSAHFYSSTDKWEYYVYSDGRVEYQYNGCTPDWKRRPARSDKYWSGLKTKKLAEDNFSELCKLLEVFPEMQAHRECDGTGYEMTLYAANGEKIHEICGHIDGNAVLEEIENRILE